MNGLTHSPKSTLQLFDYIGPGIDFSAEESTVVVTRPDGTVVPSASVDVDNANNRLLWMAETRLPRDGSADGVYTVSVTYSDFIGQKFTRDFALTFDTQPARIVSTNPIRDGRIRQLERANVVLEDNLSGVDFDSTTVQLLDSANNPIPTSVSNDGQKQITLTFDPFKTDGSADGVYRLEITPADLAGNVGGLSIVEFVYATHAPEIETLTPADGTFVNRVPEIRVLVLDRSGEGIDFEKSTIGVSDSNDVNVAGILGNDGDRTLALKLGLPTDGAADGRYTVNLNLVDNLGVSAAYTRQFTYDSVPPTIVAASRLPVDNRIIAEIEVTDTSAAGVTGSGVDFDATTIELQDSEGESVAGEKKDDGVKMITFSSAELTSVGVYTLTVAAADRAGNVSVPQRFTYGILIKPPRVASMSPPMKSSVNHLTEISIVIEDESGAGIDFPSSSATVELRNPGNMIVGGTVVNDGNDTLTLKLAEPLLTDGGDDGVYTVSVQPVDRRGVSGDVRQFTITYDTQAPRVQSVSHIDMTANISNVKDSVRRIEAEIVDDGTGVDFDNSHVRLWRDTEDERVLVPGVLDNDGALLWWQLDAPFTRSGLDDGFYSVEVKAVDAAGNAETKEYRLLYDTQTPAVSAIQAIAVAGDTLELATGSTPSVVEAPIHRIHVGFSDGSGSGIDASQTTLQLVHSDGAAIGATLQDDGAGQLTLTFDPFRTDGSADGVYRLEITPADLAGNVGGLSIVEFVYATHAPEIEALTPADGAFVNRVPEIRVLVLDRSGEGIDFEKSTIGVSDANDVNVAGILGNDEDRTLALKLGLPTDGAADGRYTVNLNLVDNLGVSAAYTRQFTYDSVPPTIVAASRLPVDNRIIAEIEVTDDASVAGVGSGVDFDATTVELQDSDGESVAGEKKDDGVKMITFSSAELTSVGVYTLTVAAADRAGNVSVPQRFTYGILIKPPRVASMSPPMKSSVNHLAEISIVIEDESGAGIDFPSSSATVELRNPGNMIVGGTVVNDGNDTLTLKLAEPLLTDGGDDGVYTVSVQPVDRRGVSGDVRQFTITYDTQAPRVQSVSHIDMTANISNVKDSVRRIEAEIVDDGTGVDFDNSHVRLWRDTEDERVLVPGVLDNDGALLWWQLDAPFTRSGLDDGFYSVEVKAVDAAGNAETKEYRLLYDTQTPAVSAIQAIAVAGDTLELATGSTPSVVEAPIHRIHVVFSDGSGSGIDASQTTLQLVHSDGAAIGATLQDDGAGQLTLTFDPFKTDGSADGVYRLEITPADLAGNVGGLSIVEFVYATHAPEIETLTPADGAFVNRVPEIRALILDRSGEGIDFEKSTIGVSDVNNLGVAGILGNDGDRTLALKLGLPTDGAADGTYTVNLNLVDNLGVSAAYTRQFTYDSVPPTIVAASRLPVDNRIIAEIEVTDASAAGVTGSGVDFDATTIELQDSDGESVAGEKKGRWRKDDYLQLRRTDERRRLYANSNGCRPRRQCRRAAALHLQRPD